MTPHKGRRWGPRCKWTVDEEQGPHGVVIAAIILVTVADARSGPVFVQLLSSVGTEQRSLQEEVIQSP